MPKMSLKAARVNRKLTQNEAAKKLGIARKTLQSWESGLTYPNALQILDIENVYHVKYDDIIFFNPNNA
jgi:putative transcriptional regulator